MTRISDRMKNIKGMSDELGEMGKGDIGKAGTFEFVDPAAEKVSYASRFNPKNEVHVEKAKALLEDPQLKGVYTEAEVKNAFDFEGLYQSHFDKGQVDIAVLLEQAGHNIPQMRASARDVLLQLTKIEDAVPFAEIDLKYITEGGGGRAGDPINLMVKYFGKNVTENLPKEATKEGTTKFTEFLMKAKDPQGRGIRDPFFDRESIEFSEFASGGRVGYHQGGGSGQPNPQGGGGEQKTLEDMDSLNRSHIGNGFYKFNKNLLNNPDYFKPAPPPNGCNGCPPNVSEKLFAPIPEGRFIFG
jgi:hypothetical protein